MAATRRLAMALCLCCLAWPGTGVAAYRIHLKNGRTVITTYYWQEGQTIRFYTPSGLVGLDASAVRDIQTVEEPVQSTAPRAAEPAAAPVVAAPAAGQTAAPAAGQTATPAAGQTAGGPARQRDLAVYSTRRDQIQAQIDLALERYWAASSAHDAAAKVRLQHEITVWSKRLLELLEEVKQQHHGRLPDGWEPLY